MRLPPAPGAVVERPQDRAALLRLVSLLLRYPDAGLPAARPELRKAVAALSDGHPRQALEQFLWWFGDRQPLPLARHYVETLDLRRRSSLHLTSYLHGDARRRDMALLTLEQRYRVAGLTPP
ncbi:nitrate reductase molybdenum cofactor assembly chaperone [Nonomuraea sp. NPDC001636]|uniref:nitrate reductase molybdenum cofactor assembly chaperone n=1 Tax=Nonomuraea sp. NPDC001636 TaxID=3154391 RepID=UPI00332FE79C